MELATASDAVLRLGIGYFAQHQLEQLDADPAFDVLHLVTHSMGGIVARAALDRYRRCVHGSFRGVRESMRVIIGMRCRCAERSELDP